MKPRQFHVAIARFPYGGNGGVSSEVPNIADWLVRTALYAKTDERIEKLSHFCISDTPITMTRNFAVQKAKEIGADILLMVDSDMWPDIHLGRVAGAKSFFETSFDFLCRHFEKGPLVIGAPYCGGPPHENVFVFEWKNFESDIDHPGFALEAYTREQAAIRGGFEACAALPTGLIMYDMRIFNILTPPYFAYEWKNAYAAEKASTEDVMATRDMHLRGLETLGYNPVYVNWDAWAGHWKPKCVGKPVIIRAEDVSEKYRKALSQGVGHMERLIDVGADDVSYDSIPHFTAIMQPSENGHVHEEAIAHREGRAQAVEDQAAAACAAPGRTSREHNDGVRGLATVRQRIRPSRGKQRHATARQGAAPRLLREADSGQHATEPATGRRGKRLRKRGRHSA